MTDDFPKMQDHFRVALVLAQPRVQLGKVVGQMMLHDDYDEFRKQLNKIAPLYPEVPGLFDDPKEWE